MREKKYSQCDDLGENMKFIYDNVNPFKCNICENKYLMPYSLSDKMKRHIKNVHANVKPFKVIFTTFLTEK